MWEKNPIQLLVFALAAILVGTVVTMVAPFAFIDQPEDRIPGVKPYTALELAGRDVYIREGCNNCHSQTVRPLVADVLRYGPYSKSGEFVYDRPFLWGSRRTGPDLARIGGKYGDEWHYQHLRNPQALAPDSNMPAYGFLDDESVDPALTRRKMAVLDFPFTEEEIQALEGKTAMDALVAYLQRLGTDIGWRERQSMPVTPSAMENPFAGDPAMVVQGADLYREHCAGCHGADRSGNIGPDLTDMADADPGEVFQIVRDGIPDGGMPGYGQLGSQRLWKIVTFLLASEGQRL